MNVKELIEWLSKFEDQEAEVEVVYHTSGTGYYDQGGSVSEVIFDPEQHAEYVDLRGNPFVAPGAPHENKRTLLLGSTGN